MMLVMMMMMMMMMMISLRKIGLNPIQRDICLRQRPDRICKDGIHALPHQLVWI
jgi:hypothetical protein